MRLAEAAHNEIFDGQRRPIARNAVIDSWRDINVLMVVTGHQHASRAREVYPVNSLNSLSFSSGDVS